MLIEELITLCKINNFKLTMDFNKDMIEVYVYKENTIFSKSMNIAYDLIVEVKLFCLKNKYQL